MGTKNVLQALPLLAAGDAAQPLVDAADAPREQEHHDEQQRGHGSEPDDDGTEIGLNGGVQVDGMGPPGAVDRY